jgi:hypothetical protein
MIMQSLRWSKTALVALAACAALSGCLVAAPPPVRPVAYADATLYGDGYVVHYDTAGLPYYYSGRTVRYVPRSHPRYGEYVQRRPRHYRRY